MGSSDILNTASRYLHPSVAIGAVFGMGVSIICKSERHRSVDGLETTLDALKAAVVAVALQILAVHFGAPAAIGAGLGVFFLGSLERGDLLRTIDRRDLSFLAGFFAVGGAVGYTVGLIGELAATYPAQP